MEKFIEKPIPKPRLTKPVLHQNQQILTPPTKPQILFGITDSINKPLLKRSNPNLLKTTTKRLSLDSVALQVTAVQLAETDFINCSKREKRFSACLSKSLLHDVKYQNKEKNQQNFTNVTQNQNILFLKQSANANVPLKLKNSTKNIKNNNSVKPTNNVVFGIASKFENFLKSDDCIEISKNFVIINKNSKVESICETNQNFTINCREYFTEIILKSKLRESVFMKIIQQKELFKDNNKIQNSLIITTLNTIDEAILS